MSVQVEFYKFRKPQLNDSDPEKYNYVIYLHYTRAQQGV